MGTLNSYQDKVIFHLPGAFELFNFYSVFLPEINKNPDILKDNVEIGSVYGSTSVPWNGGRNIPNLNYTIPQLQIIQEFYQTMNIPVRFTFTNQAIIKKHLDDIECNVLLKIFDNKHNQILCFSPMLEKYIRQQYGNNYQYISSITKQLSKEQTFEELKKDYTLVVIPYAYSDDIEFLTSLPHKDKCEILVNEARGCRRQCPYRPGHYYQISNDQLHKQLTQFGCPFMKEGNPDNTPTTSCEDIDKIYLPLGFHNFKLQGRDFPPYFLFKETICPYIIKDKYINELENKFFDLEKEQN